MVLSYDERVELLKKARQAKADKKLIKANEIEVVKRVLPSPEIEIPEEPKPKTPKEPKTPKRPPKTAKAKEATKTLDISKPTPMPDFVDSEPEVEEQIIYKPKEKKKKKIIRKIIMEESSDEDVEIIEEIIKKPKQKERSERKDHAPERPIKAEAVPPKPVATPVPQGNMFFNF